MTDVTPTASFLNSAERAPAVRWEAAIVAYTLAVRRRTVGRSPWRWVIAAVGLMFVGLELPSLFEPLPDYAQNDAFELVMFYVLPAVIVTFGVGLTLLPFAAAFSWTTGDWS